MKNGTLNKEFLSQYKPVFTDQLIQRSYEKKAYLTGKDILHLTPLKQLNLFILKSLFRAWQDEMKRLESPYFDYKEAAVRKSMVKFMNELSQHIKVGADDMRPLLLEALEDTFTLAFAPGEYLEKELSPKAGSVLSAKLIRQVTKYLDIHRDEVNQLLEGCENMPIEDVLDRSGDHLAGINKAPVAGHLEEKLSEVLVADKNDFMVPAAMTEQSPESQIAEADSQTESITDTDEEWTEDEGQAFAPDKVRAVEDREESASENDELDSYDEDRTKEGSSPEDDDMHTPEEEEVGDTPAPETSEVHSVPEAEVDVDDEQSGEDTRTVHEAFEVESKTLADLHEEKNIDSIMEAISINHRYMFLQELFDGDNEQFSKAIEEVEACGSFDEAVELLVQSYARNNAWDMNSDEVKELLKVIFRKFR